MKNKAKSTYEKFIEDEKQKNLLDAEFKELLITETNGWIIGDYGTMAKISSIESFIIDFDETDKEWVVKVTTSNSLLDLFRSENESECGKYMVCLRDLCLPNDRFFKPGISQQSDG